MTAPRSGNLRPPSLTSLRPGEQVQVFVTFPNDNETEDDTEPIPNATGEWQTATFWKLVRSSNDGSIGSPRMSKAEPIDEESLGDFYGIVCAMDRRVPSSKSGAPQYVLFEAPLDSSLVCRSSGMGPKSPVYKASNISTEDDSEELHRSQLASFIQMAPTFPNVLIKQLTSWTVADICAWVVKQICNREILNCFVENGISGLDVSLMRNWKNVRNATGITDDDVSRFLWGKLKQLQYKQLEKIKQKMTRELIPFEELHLFIEDPGKVPKFISRRTSVKPSERSGMKEHERRINKKRSISVPWSMQMGGSELELSAIAELSDEEKTSPKFAMGDPSTPAHKKQFAMLDKAKKQSTRKRKTKSEVLKFSSSNVFNEEQYYKAHASRFEERKKLMKRMGKLGNQPHLKVDKDFELPPWMAKVESEQASYRKRSANEMHSEYRRGDSSRYERELAEMGRAPTVSQIGTQQGYQQPEYSKEALAAPYAGVGRKFSANDMHTEYRRGDSSRYERELAQMGRAPTVSQIGTQHDYQLPDYTKSALSVPFNAMNRTTSAKDIHSETFKRDSKRYDDELSKMGRMPTVAQIGSHDDYQLPKWSDNALRGANEPTQERFMVPASNVKTDYSKLAENMSQTKWVEVSHKVNRAKRVAKESPSLATMSGNVSTKKSKKARKRPKKSNKRKAGSKGKPKRAQRSKTMAPQKKKKDDAYALLSQPPPTSFHGRLAYDKALADIVS